MPSLLPISAPGYGRVGQGTQGPPRSERAPMAKWEKEQSQLKIHLSPCPPSHVPHRAVCGHGWAQRIHQELGAGPAAPAGLK